MRKSLPLFSSIVCAFSLAGADAATITVTTIADSGAGSLRAAIVAAAAGDTIQFAAALNGQTITLTSAQLLIDKNLTITGPGASQLTVRRSAAGGIPIFRIFEITPGHTVSIEGLIISNGLAQNATPGDLGGGIYNNGSTLSVANCVISSNSAINGGGIYSGNAVASGSATLTVSNSTISDNTADFGGGVYGSGSSFGNAVLTISNSTISGNTGDTGGGGGVYASGKDSGSTTVTIRNSTLHTNTTRQLGAGVLNFASNSGVATLTIENSTISFNAADFGGGGIFNSGNGGSAALIITHSTMVGNTMGLGRGIYNSNATVHVGSTILFDANIFNNSGTVTSLGYNVCNDMGGGFLTATGDQINVNPMTGQLQNNGGPTWTHELLTGSPAINAGDPSFTPPPDFDQRGAGFPRVVNGRVDVGSFEVQPATPTPTPTATATGAPTATATATATPRATATPTPTPTATAAATPTATTKLLNISTRLRVLTGDNALIGGFIVTGNTPKRVIVRAIGPSLTNFGIPGALADPVLELHGPGAFIPITNDNWRDTQEAEIAATGIAPSNDLESAIVATLTPGAYTAIVRGNNDETGVGLVEAYDLQPVTDARLANISTRGFVDSGDNVMIGGFILGNGSANARILIRAIGPSLAVFGVPNALADPTLELHNNNGDIIAANDDWRDTQQAEIEATGIPPSDDRESAIIRTLPPGAYTAILRGKNDTTGVALVEAYQLASPTPTPTPTPPATPTPTPTPTPSPTPPARFGSLASSAMVGTGDAVTLNAFIVTGSGPRQVLVRGLGPSLALPMTLADPQLDLRAAGGGLISSNNNWRDTQEAEIIATGLPPGNDLESAIVASFNSGSYTVVLRSHTGASGRGVNDLYDLSASGSSALSAVGTRANVLTGSDLLSSGIVMPQGGDILVCVLGPSLTAAGVSGVLADPTLELRDSNGALLMANDNWRDTQEAEIQATGIAPSNDLEAALVINLPPGSYTGLALGRNNTIGIGYLQFYSLPHSGALLPLTP